MSVKKYVLHSLILFVEGSVFFGLTTTVLVRQMDHNAQLVHLNSLSGCVVLSIGLSACLLSIVQKSGLLSRDGGPKVNGMQVWASAVLGVLLLLSGIIRISSEYPEKFRSSKLKTGQERFLGFEAVKVNFDAAEGQCSDCVRIVEYGRTYGNTMNVYPSEDERYFTALYPGRINLPRGLLILSGRNDGEAAAFVHYFTTNVVPVVSSNETWTYVVDIESFSGEIADWYVGQTLPTNLNEYVCFERGRIGADVKSGDKKFCHLRSNQWSSLKLLDRAVIVLGPGHDFDMSFRVSLFAGNRVDESNYHYVKPGETIACPLPVPARDGYAFEGWYDGDRRITEESKVEKRESHTLKARWRKL